MPLQDARPIRIAISGGGIAGASLFHALLKHDHLDVHIFESAPQFREAGAAVGLTSNAQQALGLLGASATESFKRAGAVQQTGVKLLLALGDDAGETIVSVGGGEKIVGIVHRAALLRELLADAPSNRMHASKKLEAIDELPGGPIYLHFTDGTQHECDVLIGADGIHSRVRKYILGVDDPAASPVPGGWWLAQVLKPYSQAAAFLDKPYFDKDKPGEVGWCGNGTLIYHNILNDGELAAFVIGGVCEEGTSNEWQGTVTADEIRQAFSAWPSNLANAVDNVRLPDLMSSCV